MSDERANNEREYHVNEDIPFMVQGNLIALVEPDPEPNSPRDWDNIGKMVCWHSRYDLGDSHAFATHEDFLLDLADSVDADRWEVVNGAQADAMQALYDRDLRYNSDEYIRSVREIDTEHGDALVDIIETEYVMLPLYLYDHSGITMRTYSFPDRWDSGQIGYIYVSLEHLREEYADETDEVKLRDEGTRRLESEVETYTSYLEGQVYGIVVYRMSDDAIDDDDMIDLGHVRHYGEELDAVWSVYATSHEFDALMADALNDYQTLPND